MKEAYPFFDTSLPLFPEDGADHRHATRKDQERRGESRFAYGRKTLLGNDKTLEARTSTLKSSSNVLIRSFTTFEGGGTSSIPVMSSFTKTSSLVCELKQFLSQYTLLPAFPFQHFLSAIFLGFSRIPRFSLFPWL